MPAQRRSPSTRAATSQLKTADQSARVGKASRAKDEYGELIVPLVIHAAVRDEDGKIVRDEDGKIVREDVTQDFRLAEDVGIMPLMEWAAAAEGSEDESSRSLVAIFYVLEDTVHEEDWNEFREFGRKNKAQAGDYGKFINAALEALAGRPTEEPSGSSDG